MKKIFVFISIMFLSISLVSCGEKDNTSGSKTSANTNISADAKTDKNIPEDQLCDTYLGYLECNYEQIGMAKEGIEMILNQETEKWADFSEDEKNSNCKKLVNDIRSKGLLKGCEF